MPQTSLPPPTTAFVGAAWAALLTGTVAFLAGLWNAGLAPSEKGFYAMAFALSMFAAVTVQKNVRDLAAARKDPPGPPAEWT